jgi:O-antigen ligase
MNSVKPLQWVGIGLGAILAMYVTYTHLYYFGNVSFLGGILLLEILVASLWKYDQRFFVLLMIAFLWAGMNVPMQSAWTSGRWAVLFAGAAVGCIAWMTAPRRPFGSLHLVALFCICTALVSATVSTFLQMASLKALSLFLLFLYCASGARLAVLGREDRFFHGLLWGSEIAVYVTAICYFGLGESIWGNPNSLGASMSVGVFPILLWGWFTSDVQGMKLRRLAALLLCAYLVFFSGARAAMASVALVTLVFCVCLHQYKLLIKLAALVLVLIAATGVLAPGKLDTKLTDLKNAVLYKGHEDAGVLGSRRRPWEETIAIIKQHPFFGTGYGTSPTGENPGLGSSQFESRGETVGEHGSSYMTIAAWVGLLGLLPFVALLAITVTNLWKVCAWMRQTRNPRHYSIPLAMLVIAGLAHASFEDWLFAVGYYLCVYFWFFAFLLPDLIPGAVTVPGAVVVSRTSRQSAAGFGVGVSGR